MNYEELTQEIRQLSVEERKALISFIVDTFTETKDRSLRELRGLGKEIWAGIDAQEYIDQQRDEWDRN